MTSFLDVALYSFWTFLGTVIILSLLVKGVVALVVGLTAALRRSPVHIGDINHPAGDDTVEVVRKAMLDGELDAAVARVNARNRQRGAA